MSDLYARFGIPQPEAFSTQLNLYLAESHNEMRLIIAHYLAKLGFPQVRLGRDGRVALADLKNNPAHIAIIGDDVPFVTGLDMIRELRENPQLTRGAFVLLSKPLNKNEVMLALEMGVDDLLVRPITQGDIMPKLRSAYNSFINPKNPERVYEHAKALLRKDSFDEAKEVYLCLSESTTKAARPFIGLARVHFAKNDFDKALNYIKEGLLRNENFVHGYVLRAEILMKMGEKRKAVEDLKHAIVLSPLNMARYESCSEILLANQMIEDCCQILEKAVSAGLKHHFIIERLGHCYFTKKDYAQATKYLKEAVRLEPNNNSYLNSLAICFRDSNDYEKAVQCYNQIIKKEPENHLVLFNKSLTLILWKKAEEAAKILRRVLKIKPDYQKARDKLKEIGASEEE